jgi:hypothetical protein
MALLRGRPRYRSFALAFCGLFTLSVFGAYVHRATVLHGYCTDHGEVIHLKQLHHRHFEDGQRPVATPVINLEGPHGCVFLQFLTQTSSVHSTGHTTGENCPALAAPATPWLKPLSSVPLLLQSPKTSPPRSC